MKPGPGEIRLGSHTLRILRQKDGFAGIVVGQAKDPVFGVTALEVETKLRARLAENHPDFIGLDGARRRFLALFRDGFSDPDYIGDRRLGERHYKQEAARLLAETLPLAAVGTTDDQGLAALRAIQRTNLVDPFSKAKLADVLRGPRAGRFLAIARDFAEGDSASACSALVREFKDEGAASWVCLTYLPFLWRPDRHMFLKPGFTVEFARRIGHRFQDDYRSTPDPAVYASLLHLTSTLAAGLADLAPADNIDLHSFMWVVMSYRDNDVNPSA